jgi:hypothetical protein
MPLTSWQITESILDNQGCFLEQSVWIMTLRSIVTDNPLEPERSPLVMSLLIILLSIPRLFRDITAAICHFPSPPLATIAKLITRAQKLRSSLQCWYSSNFRPDTTLINGPVLCPGYNRILILFYICSIYSNRLNTCMYWSGTPDIQEMEEESQRFASIVVSVYKEETCSNSRSSLLLAQKLPIAEATIESGSDWMQHLIRGTWQTQLFKMQKQTYEHWCSLFGRKTS